MINIRSYKKKERVAWHITTATHNSRYSQRMFDNYVKLGKPVWLNEKEELIVTETIAEIVEKDKLNIIAYNICGDHMHMLLVCEESEVPKIVGKIKAMSARACNIEMGRTTMGHAPSSHPDEAHPDEAHPDEAHPDEAHPDEAHPDEAHPGNSTAKVKKRRGKTQSKLWTQKFGKSEVNSENYLNNAIAYIRNNRVKHELPYNSELQLIVQQMCCSVKQAFRT